MDEKYILKIFSVFIILYAIILFINVVGLHKYNDVQETKKLVQVVTVEVLNNNNNINASLAKSGPQAFCAVNKGYTLEKQCNFLTENGCNETSCCVWTNKQKCVAGSKSGPTFSSDNYTNTDNYYYYQSKCYGSTCPNK